MHSVGIRVPTLGAVLLKHFDNRIVIVDREITSKNPENIIM